MHFRRAALRLVAALVAVVQTFAPGAASIIDARSAAITMSERVKTHADTPGSPHAFAHDDRCALCAIATHEVGPPTTRAVAPDAGVAVWPPRASWLAHYDSAERWLARSRAPPA